MNRLKAVMLRLIVNETPLGPEWLDHPLKGVGQGIGSVILAVIFY